MDPETASASVPPGAAGPDDDDSGRYSELATVFLSFYPAVKSVANLYHTDLEPT